MQENLPQRIVENKSQKAETSEVEEDKLAMISKDVW